MAAPDRIHELIERFKFNEVSYRSQAYNETQLRREFLDPFFETLGWDVDNRQGYAEAYKDVIHEDAIKIGGATKAPDYCFRVGGARKFFLEAKKPAINIKDDISPAFQLRRYAWSAKLPLSILSDFEEFAVYDCRTEPVKTDKAAIGRVLYCRYTDYLDKWDEIAGTFSKDAILKGSFDKYAAGKNRKGTQEVDAAFLKEIESWRESLAKNLAFPAIKNHLAQWKDDLTPKASNSQKKGRKPGSYQWYEIQDDVAYYSIFESPKIIFPDIAKEPRFYLDKTGAYLANTGYALDTDDAYLLGILNGRLCWFTISNISIPFGVRAGKFRYRLIYQYMEKVPIRPINFNNLTDRTRHDRMVALVEGSSNSTVSLPPPRLAPNRRSCNDRLTRPTDRLIGWSMNFMT